VFELKEVNLANLLFIVAETLLFKAMLLTVPRQENKDPESQRCTARLFGFYFCFFQLPVCWSVLFGHDTCQFADQHHFTLKALFTCLPVCC
jgi:hypothetical protein